MSLMSSNRDLQTVFVLLLVSLTWNGSSVTRPVMIFQDEILILNDTLSEAINDLSGATAGVLLCSSQSPSGVSWYFANNDVVPDAPASVFQQIRSVGNSSLALLSRGMDESDFSSRSSGLWICRLNGSTIEKPVAIYRRNER